MEGSELGEVGRGGILQDLVASHRESLDFIDAVGNDEKFGLQQESWHRLSYALERPLWLLGGG